MNDQSQIFESKMTMLSVAIGDLPKSILGMKIGQLSYENINQILNILVPRIIRVDVRIFWAMFDRDSSNQLTALARETWSSEIAQDPSIRESKAFILYCGFLLANVQYNIAGSNNLSERVSHMKMEDIAFNAKISVANANIMFNKIFGNNLSGKRPSGCGLSIVAFILFPGALAWLLS